MGLLRLHATYRHDLKIYASEEGRCLKTTANFTKGLLDLDTALEPILETMVKYNSDLYRKLLDDNSEAQPFQESVK